ncbi:MAG: hypothetical protein COB05_09305 [Marinobacter sp.]|nr:MAG: hypothetical protein COB05_09305 [Marinobacter sp.]
MRFLIPLLLCASICYSQNRKATDSMRLLLNSEIHDTTRIITLNQMSWSIKQTNLDSSINLASEALRISKSIKWQHGMANSFAKLGVFYYFRGEYHKSREYHSYALEINIDLGRLRQTAINLGNIGVAYRNLGDYPNALEYYFRALSIEEKMGRKKGIATKLGNIGIVYKEQEDLDKALEYYLKALEISEEINDTRGVARHLGNIGVVYRKRFEYSSALEYYFRAVKLEQETGNIYGESGNYSNIGNVYMDLKDYPMALEYQLKGLVLYKEIGNVGGVALNLGNIGVTYTELEEYGKAEEYLKQALAHSSSSGIKELLKDQYLYISRVYDSTDNPSKAFSSYKMHIVYRDSLNNEENTRAQTRTEMKYEYEKAQLVKEQEEKEAARVVAEETSRRNNLQYSVILIAILILFGGVLSLGFINVSERMAEGIIFFSFLILFEFLLVLADPYIDKWSGGAPGFKLLFNAGIAALIFPMHAFFEGKMKKRLVKS